MTHILDYEQMIQKALMGVVRESLQTMARKGGAIGGHHFYITFTTKFPGVVMPRYLVDRYPEEITIVLQHEFWDLAVKDKAFQITLSFDDKLERLTIPFQAITSFVDPFAKFGLQFTFVEHEEGTLPSTDAEHATPETSLADNMPDSSSRRKSDAAKKDGASDSAKVISLDQFRKK